MKPVFALIAVALIGFTSSASAHDCCAPKKAASSCCVKKAKASCCAKHEKACCAKKAKTGCCARHHGRAVLGYNGLGNPVHHRKVSHHPGCKLAKAKGKCCKSGAAHQKVKQLSMDSPCPVAKPGCCAS